MLLPVASDLKITKTKFTVLIILFLLRITQNGFLINAQNVGYSLPFEFQVQLFLAAAQVGFHFNRNFHNDAFEDNKGLVL